jgi:hypothetical protein
MARQSDDFFNAPDVDRDASSHRGRDAQSLVDTGEIGVHEVQGHGRDVVLDLLGKSG